MWTAREALESHVDSPGGSRELRHSVSPEAPEEPRELSKWFFPASLVPPWCLANCPIDPFLPPWRLAGYPNGFFLPPWCVPGASQTVQFDPFLPPWCLASYPNGSFLPPWCLADCPIYPFLPPWRLLGCPKGSFLPPWCLLVSRSLSQSN